MTIFNSQAPFILDQQGINPSDGPGAFYEQLYRYLEAAQQTRQGGRDQSAYEQWVYPIQPQQQPQQPRQRYPSRPNVRGGVPTTWAANNYPDLVNQSFQQNPYSAPPAADPFMRSLWNDWTYNQANEYPDAYREMLRNSLDRKYPGLAGQPEQVRADVFNSQRANYATPDIPNLMEQARWNEGNPNREYDEQQRRTGVQRNFDQMMAQDTEWQQMTPEMRRMWQPTRSEPLPQVQHDPQFQRPETMQRIMDEVNWANEQAAQRAWLAHVESTQPYSPLAPTTDTRWQLDPIYQRPSSEWPGQYDIPVQWLRQEFNQPGW